MTDYAALAGLVTFRPLTNPFRHNVSRRVAPFRASWSSTVDLLRRELQHVGAKDTVMQVALGERDIRLDGLPRANARSSSPCVIVSFRATAISGQAEDLTYELDAFSDWQDNVRGLALGLEALRKVERYGISKRGEQYRGWKALASGSVGEGDPTRGAALVSQAGSLAKALHAAHPDHGGADQDFRDIIAYRDRGTA